MDILKTSKVQTKDNMSFTNPYASKFDLAKKSAIPGDSKSKGE